MAHGLNTNLVFKWRRSLHAGEYDQVSLMPVVVESSPAAEIEQPMPIPASGTMAGGMIEISVGCAKVRIEGVPDESSLTLVLRLLRGEPT